MSVLAVCSTISIWMHIIRFPINITFVHRFCATGQALWKFPSLFFIIIIVIINIILLRLKREATQPSACSSPPPPPHACTGIITIVGAAMSFAGVAGLELYVQNTHLWFMDSVFGIVCGVFLVGFGIKWVQLGEQGPMHACRRRARYSRARACVCALSDARTHA